MGTEWRAFVKECGFDSRAEQMGRKLETAEHNANERQKVQGESTAL